MSNDRDPLRKSGEKKISPMNNNVVWFLLVLGVLTLLTVSMMTGGPDEKVLCSDLLELIKIADDKDGKNYIEVHRGTGDKEHVVRLSNPTDIKVGTYEIVCAQLCGAGHYGMRGTLVVDTDADYQSWLHDMEQLNAPAPVAAPAAPAAGGAK